MTNNIKQQLFSGVFYTAIAKYSGIIISLVVAGILARLLSPDDFGIVAIATVIISFFAIFTDMGLSPAIIQNKALTQDDLTNIYSFTFWTGIAVALLFFIASWPISAYYDSLYYALFASCYLSTCSLHRSISCREPCFTKTRSSNSLLSAALSFKSPPAPELSLPH